MKKITLLLILALSGMVMSMKAQTWSEDFNSGIPSTWMQYNDANSASTTYFGATLIARWTKNAWITNYTGVAGDSMVITTSSFTPAATADRWLITPRFKVNDVHTYLYFHYLDFTANTSFQDVLMILVSTSDSAKSSFTDTIFSGSGNTSLATKFAASLGKYNGKKIRVAFVDNSYNKYVLGLDNIGTEVPTANDLQLNSITPTSFSPFAYDTIGGVIYLTGTVTNLGYDTVNTFVMKYQEGSGTPVSETVTQTIPLYGTYTYAFSTTYTIASHGTLPIKVWVELTGDANHANDTVHTNYYGAYSRPTKRLTFEEGTGTWCGWCVRGIVFMDSLYGTNPNDASFIAVHNSDPMTVTSYDSLMSTEIGGYPSVVVDRREVIDPSQIIDWFNAENTYFGFANISTSAASVTSSSFKVTANVTPTLDLSGDYRLALVLTEDKVHGAGTTWDQHNYYSSSSQNIYLSGQGVNYQKLTNPIPAAKMFYKFVARSSTPSIAGAAGSLPSTMTHGTTYSYSFTAPISSGWKESNMRAYVLLIRHSDGQILNSQEVNVNVGIQNIEAGVNSLRILPNPANNEAYLNVDLTKATDALVSITDITGKVVMQNSVSKLPAGAYYYNIPTNNLANGIYVASFQTESGTVTTKFVVAH